MNEIDDETIDVLARRHVDGRLTPFVGSGMSRPAFSTWDDLVDRLAAAAGVTGVGGDPASRGAAASRVLRAEGRLAGVVAEALRDPPGNADDIEVTDKAMRLAEIGWPLVITTNYEALHLAACWFADEAGKTPDGRLVLGRSPQHCRRVLRSLTVADHPIVWAIQGFVPDPSTSFVRPGPGSEPLSSKRMAKYLPDDDDRKRLADEIVIGHAEYRRVTHAAPHFRRTFAEVLRSRSLLFLGSGLESYLLDLVAEIGELHGPSPLPHFAVYSDGDPDKVDERRARALTHGIQPIFLPGHDEIAPFLERLARRIGQLTGAAPPRTKTPRRLISWAYEWSTGPQVRIERRYFADDVGAGEVHVFSLGGRSAAPTAGGRARNILGIGTRKNSVESVGWTRRATEPIPVWADPTHRRLGVHARLPPTAAERPLSSRAARRATEDPSYWRDLRIIPLAMTAILDAVSRSTDFAGVDTVTIEPLATGSLRTFPAPAAFVQMLRGLQRWVDRNRVSRIGHVNFILQPGHTGDDAILAALDAGWVSPAAVLDDPSVHFWIETPVDADEMVAVPSAGLPDDRLADHVRRVLPLRQDRSDRGWSVDVSPAPCKGWEKWALDEMMHLTLDEFGVVTGSVVDVFRSERAG